MFVFAAVIVTVMASIFVFSQIRQLWHYASVAVTEKKWSTVFWVGLAMFFLIGTMVIFYLSFFDMLDGKFDLLFPKGDALGH
jgi:hypothetical protein